MLNAIHTKKVAISLHCRSQELMEPLRLGGSFGVSWDGCVGIGLTNSTEKSLNGSSLSLTFITNADFYRSLRGGFPFKKKKRSNLRSIVEQRE